MLIQHMVLLGSCNEGISTRKFPKLSKRICGFVHSNNMSIARKN